MPITYQSELVIGRASDVVFAYLTELPKMALWTEARLRPITDGGLRTGASFDVSLRIAGLKPTVGVEMTAVDDNERLVWRTFKGPVDWVGDYRLTAEGATTRVRQQGTLTFKWPWRLLQPIAGGRLRTRRVRELEKLKSVVEAES